jgi:hypothetical protein
MRTSLYPSSPPRECQVQIDALELSPELKDIKHTSITKTEVDPLGTITLT